MIALDSLQVRTIRSLAEVAPAEWDALVDVDEPFTEHAFLLALESSGSVGPPSTGWLPRHVLVRAGPTLVGAMPLYERHDSYGEYIFDWGWAQAAARAGIPYYPKLTSAVPFTPVSGRRLLSHPDAPRRPIVETLLDAALAEVHAGVYSSLHLLFCTEEEVGIAVERGMWARRSFQFQWHREPGWRSYEDFLAALRAPARKQLRKERLSAAAHGLSLEMIGGEALTEGDVAALERFYRNTASDKWGRPYLTSEFFTALTQPGLRPRVVAAFARDGADAVAGALFFARGKSLLGRYWGADRFLDAMHFELCYNLPIEWSLAHDIDRFEAGAQGEHKLKRGLLPHRTHSAHLVAHPGLGDAVRHFLDREAPAVDAEIASYLAQTPFQRGAAAASTDR